MFHKHKSVRKDVPQELTQLNGAVSESGDKNRPTAGYQAVNDGSLKQKLDIKIYEVQPVQRKMHSAR